MPLVAGRYELGPMLGSGGFATVYRARDPVEDRDVAIKVIPFSLWPLESADEQAAQLERFRSEALALSRLRSRHVARVHDFGRDDAVGLYLVMDLIEGVPLEARSLGRSLLPHEVLRVARGVLAGLAEAHGVGIAHCDIKPSNILIPRGNKALDEPRILDFGVARDVRRAQSREEARGVVLGTPAYMAPEQLRDGEVGPQSDVYAAGLVLFELLDAGPLFPGVAPRDQIAARATAEASLEERVPAPLSALLSRMLARDPADRFEDAADALAAIGDLETAPVSISEPPPPEGSEGERASADGHAHEEEPPRTVSERSVRHDREARSSSKPPSARRAPSSSKQRAAERAIEPVAFGGKRLSRLAKEPEAALIETINALDLAMIDALARRERGSTMARVARAVALTLRLELDAAAILLEPLAPQSDLARAFGASLIAPRARRATRARADGDRPDTWVESLDVELAAQLVSVGTMLTTRDDAPKNEARCKRVLARLGEAAGPSRTTVRMAQIAATTLTEGGARASPLAEMMRLRESDSQPPPPFHVLVRATFLGMVGFRADEHLAREQFERAARLAADTCNTLLEARAMVAWGGMLVEIPERVEQGLAILERATTLLAHGDAPSLEYVAEHNRGAALVIQARYAEAAPHLRRAREAAKGELSLEHEMLSCMNEGLSLVCLGNREAAGRVVDELTDARLAHVSPRTAAFGHIARSMFAALLGDREAEATELRRAHASAAQADKEAGDAYLLAEVLGILYASGRHEPIDLFAHAAELQKLAHDRGFASFYWFDMLRAFITQTRDELTRVGMTEALDRLLVLLGDARLASERPHA